VYFSFVVNVANDVNVMIVVNVVNVANDVNVMIVVNVVNVANLRNDHNLLNCDIIDKERRTK